MTFSQALVKRKYNLCCILAVLCLYCINQIILKPYLPGLLGNFFRYYFNDILCPILILAYSEIFLIWIGREIVSYPRIILFGLLCGVFWEVIGTKINSRAVFDIWDLVSYFCGINLYFFIMKGYKY